MATYDAHTNFGYSLIAVAPTPAASGTTFNVTTGEGAVFPTVPFNIVIWPAGANPSTTNAEICRVTSKGTGDNWTVTRTQESSSARAIALGDQVANAITVKVLTDVEASITALIPGTTAPTTTGNITAEPIPTGTGDLVTYHKNASLKTIQGMVAGIHGQRWTHYSKGAGQVDFAHLHASGTALGKCTLFATSGFTSMGAGTGAMTFQYDSGVVSGATANWGLASHEQGAWITPTYAGGDYTASSGTWTVDSGDVVTCAYRLSGRTLTWQIYLVTTSVSATPGSLTRALPAGFTVGTRSDAGAVWRAINGAAAAAAGVRITSSAIDFYPLIDQSGSWSISTNLTTVAGVVHFGVA
jgi:hypothetical protein